MALQPMTVSDRGDAVECVWEAGCLVGEGPVWDTHRQRLWFVDLKGDAIHLYGERHGGSPFVFDGSPSAVVPVRASEDLLCLSRRGLERFSPADGKRRLIAPVEPEQPGNRPNDAKCDPSGRLWFGTMDDAEREVVGSLYRLDAAGRVTRMLSGIGVSNGLDWSPDGAWFYYTDSLRRTIWRFAFDVSSGELGERRVFARLGPEDGAPDGLTVDQDGYVWSAHWDGGRITRYDPAGTVERVVALPVPRPTSLCFGGPDLSVLYVTSARIGLSAETLAAAPLSGGLFAIWPGVKGMPARPAALA